MFREIHNSNEYFNARLCPMFAASLHLIYICPLGLSLSPYFIYIWHNLEASSPLISTDKYMYKILRKPHCRVTLTLSVAAAAPWRLFIILFFSLQIIPANKSNDLRAHIIIIILLNNSRWCATRLAYKLLKWKRRTKNSAQQIIAHSSKRCR